MDSRSRIDTYETIYSVVMIVANQYTTIEEIRDVVEYCDGTEIEEDVMTECASVTCCRRKSDLMACVFVKFNHVSEVKSVDKKVDLINTIAHEAGHVTLRIYQHMGQDICQCSPEPFCYLLGWAAECIYKTIKRL